MKKKTLILVNLMLAFCFQSKADNLQFRLDTSARLDIRTEKQPRWQYRVRFYPQWSLSANLSLNAFANTGKSFASSYNTLNDDAADSFYVRRLYLRHQQGLGKTEFGIIPTYKGPVASTGLSKDGWIAGLRQVFAFGQLGKLEFVAGELDHLQTPSAFQSIDKLNYFEMEYSGAFNQQTGFELSLERMLEGNFLRTELRHTDTADHQYALEFIDRLDNNKFKVVLSFSRPLETFGNQTELFAYYSYVDSNFGPRAELTEDFLSPGHALSAELTGTFNTRIALKWFAKLEHYQRSDTSRVQFGLQYKFSQR